MITDESIERVRESADIVGIIGEYVDLKRQGSSFRGPCPFHQGTDRNFSVSAKRQHYYCFVCKESGDVFKFLQQRLGLDWPSSVRVVAEKSGIQIVETHNPREQQERDVREPFWEVNAAAADYFRRILWEDDLGGPARDYLMGREIDRKLADHAGIGFAPREIGLLRNYLNTLGYDNARLIEAGLLVVPDEGTEPRPRFRNRLIFPIYDVSGRVVGFGGRLLGPGEPKYLNSAESPVFSKGKLLYALNWAKQAARRDERMLVVEGYFDVLRLIGSGVECVVAPMGTALTEDQAKLVRKYAERVYLLYDSDKAGLQATFRSGDELLRQGAAVQVVTLPEGEDPDTFVKVHGAKGLETHIAHSIDVFERKIQILERGGWFGDLRKKRQALDRLLPTLRATADPLTRDMYLGFAASAAGVSRDLLEREMQSAPRGRVKPAATGTPRAGPAGNPGAGKSSPVVAVRRAERRRHSGERAIGAEREIVRILLHLPHHFEAVMERVDLAAFRDEILGDIFSAIVTHGSEGDRETIAEDLRPDAVEVMQALLNEDGGLDRADEILAGAIAALHERSLTERLSEIDRDLPLADDAQKDELIREKTRLSDELRRLGGQWWKKFR